MVVSKVWIQNMVWYKGKVESESDSDSDEEYFSYSKKQIPDEPLRVNFLNNFYCGRRLDPRMVYPCLLQIFQRIEEDDRKDYGFLSHDHEALFEKGSTYNDKEGLFKKCLSSKLVMKNNKSISHAPLFEQNQIFIDPKQGSFLKSFYGG